jgi:uncharacterized integral membrane protein
MKTLKRWVIILLLLLVVLMTASFSLWNNVAVSLTFGLFTLDARPLSVWVISSFGLGALFGLTLGAGFIGNLKSNLRIRQLEKELQQRPKFNSAEKD